MMSRIIRDTAAGTHTACDNSNKVCMKYEVSKLRRSQTLKTVISKKKKKLSSLVTYRLRMSTCLKITVNNC